MTQRLIMARHDSISKKQARLQSFLEVRPFSDNLNLTYPYKIQWNPMEKLVAMVQNIIFQSH